MNLYQALEFVGLILLATSPVTALFWLADTSGKRFVAILLLAASLLGYQGLRVVTPGQVNNLYYDRTE